MSSDSVTHSHKGYIAHIVLDRPRAGNSIDQEIAQKLADTCTEIAQDESIYAVIVSGAGNKYFCGGNDFEWSARSKSRRAKASVLDIPQYDAAASIAVIEQPVIAAINGDAIGEGLELALSCDIRLASESARFSFPQVGLGVIPMDGGTQRLPRIVGKGKALELILTGATISAEEALDIGLVSRVVPADELETEAEALAQSIATKAPIALRYIKEAVNKGMDLTLEQGLRLEADLYFLIHTTADRTEGIQSFLRKKPPQFKGK